MCTGGVLARKVPNHSGASPGQGNKRPAASLTHLPKRPPVDVEFKNLAYSVSEGRKRGEFQESANCMSDPGRKSRFSFSRVARAAKAIMIVKQQSKKKEKEEERNVKVELSMQVGLCVTRR